MLKKITYALCALLCVFALQGQAQAKGAFTLIKFETNMGEFVLSLNEEKAPITTANFIQYVKDGFYDGLIFHRVIENFMIQGGGFTPDMKQKEGRANIENEADNGLQNHKYTIAMARTPDPHSASSQFFINTKNNAFLNYSSPTQQGWGYAVFGEVIEGKEVIDAIEKVATTSKGFHGDVPVEDVVIIKASIME